MERVGEESDDGYDDDDGDDDARMGNVLSSSRLKTHGGIVVPPWLRYAFNFYIILPLLLIALAEFVMFIRIRQRKRVFGCCIVLVLLCLAHAIARTTVWITFKIIYCFRFLVPFVDVKTLSVYVEALTITGSFSPSASFLDFSLLFY